MVVPFQDVKGQEPSHILFLVQRKWNKIQKMGTTHICKNF
ncbi:hypothetical protein SynSYN20_00717 [Synechococcus sp. SYN20]|nr:hypothetical protein SynSYN20_00717 [Synechococcus sp. SYN20]